MGPDAMILVFWMLSFNPAFSLSSFTFIKRLFSSSPLSAIRVVSFAYLRLLIFLPAVLIPVCASSSPTFLMFYSAYKLNKQCDNIQPWCTPFSIWNQSAVPCPVLSVLPDLHTDSQEAGQAVWYSHLFQNFPRFVVIYTVNEEEVDVFLWNSLAISMIQQMLAIWSLVPLLFLNLAWISGISWFMCCWSLTWRIWSVIC